LYISNLFPGQLGARNPDPGWLHYLNGPAQPKDVNGGRIPNGESELGCYIQTWYLANDMQLFLLTPIVVSCRDTADIWAAFFQECQRCSWCGQAVLFKKNRARAYSFLAAVLVAMHAYILYATASYKLSTCDQLTTNPSYGMW